MCPFVSDSEISRGSWDVAWENPDLNQRNVTEVMYLCELLKFSHFVALLNIYFVSCLSFKVSISVPGIFLFLFTPKFDLIKS